MPGTAPGTRHHIYLTQLIHCFRCAVQQDGRATSRLIFDPVAWAWFTFSEATRLLWQPQSTGWKSEQTPAEKRGGASYPVELTLTAGAVTRPTFRQDAVVSFVLRFFSLWVGTEYSFNGAIMPILTRPPDFRSEKSRRMTPLPPPPILPTRRFPASWLLVFVLLSLVASFFRLHERLRGRTMERAPFLFSTVYKVGFHPARALPRGLWGAPPPTQGPLRCRGEEKGVYSRPPGDYLFVGSCRYTIQEGGGP